MSSCKASYGLSTQCKLILLCLNRTKTLGGGAINLPPPMYHGGGMNLLVRPRVYKHITLHSEIRCPELLSVFLQRLSVKCMATLIIDLYSQIALSSYLVYRLLTASLQSTRNFSITCIVCGFVKSVSSPKAC